MTKKIIWMLVLLVGISSVMLSCKKKGCTDPAAKNYCDKCKKDDGSCQYAIQDYVGTWSVTGNCGAYTMTITASGSTLTINNFHGGSSSGWTVTATISGNSMTIPTQTTSIPSGPYTFAGSGTISGTNYNTLKITYTMKDNGGTTINCSSTCTKK